MLFLLMIGQTSAAVPCISSQLTPPAVVKDTAGALQLAAAMNCSGGSFDVEWVGSVIVEEPIRLFGGTVLTITGAVDGTSVANGSNRTSLFEVDGGTLHLYHLTLTNGTGQRGGAIYAIDAILTAASCTILHNMGVDGGGVFLDNTVLETMNSSFTHNTASASGGAMYVDASNVTMGEAILLETNTALIGGALFVTGSSFIALVGNNISFARNAATVYGGSMYANESTANVTGNVKLRGNTAECGGAVFTKNSSMSIIGDLLLSTNFANGSGGAFYSRTSAIDIAGTTVWENNSASAGGGGLVLWKSGLRVHAFGEAVFINNSAAYGGAAYTSASTFVADGDVRFAENVGNLRGGGLYGDSSTINISGNVVWENNRSPVGGGGGLLVWESNVSVQPSGTAAFVGNTADNGGAAYLDNSLLLSYGDISLSTNVATSIGGALYAGFSVVSIAGSTAWATNTAGGWGGALASFQSNIIVRPSGKAAFVNNNAAIFGGAAYASNSTLLFVGDVVFAANVAGDRGGALYSDLSTITIDGTAVWKDNSGKEGGGALLMWNSTLLVPSTGATKYFGNVAHSGGAIHSYKSSVLFGGDVIFANNVAIDLGGAVLVQNSDINVTGATSWENNTSINTGGGVAMLASTLHIVAGSNASFSKNTANIGGGMFVGESAAVVITGLATFTHNGAETGAGIKMASLSSANFAGGLVAMLGNAASSSGGGMHCESPTLLRLDGVQFVSNYGGVRGGAMTTLLAGTERVAETVAEPATLSNCSFSDNTAGDAGGAVFIGGGFIEIADSHFCHNTAGRSGGAILASGIVSLFHCVLVENRAAVGPAITNTVSVSFHSVNFMNNTLLCDENSLFLDWNDTSSFAIACESCAGECNNCTVENPDRGQECQKVLEHTTSLAADGTIESLTLQQGFWRSSGTSRDIRVCYDTSACVGGTYNYCNDGYQGPLCAVCADGYTAGLGYTCSQCNVERRSAAIMVAAVFLVAVVVIVAQGLRSLASYADQTVSGEAFPNGDVTGVQPLFIGVRASQALKVVVVTWQIVTQFSMVASVTYPDVYNGFLKYVNVANLNLGWMLSAGCLVDTDFYDNLLVATTLPLVVFCVVMVSHRVASRRHSTCDRRTRARIDSRHASALFWVSFLVYAGVSSAVFQTFACVDFDNGMSFLRVDLSIECYSTRHTLFRVYASVMGVVYPLGIPFCYAVVLYRARSALNNPAMRETTTTTDVSVARDLWVAYRPEAYFYEVVECTRRVVLSGVIVFVLPNTAGQIATAFLFALIFAAVCMVLDPYTSWFDTWAARTGHTVVLMSMFVALLQKVNTEEDDDFSQNVFGIVLIVANCVMIVAAGAEACGMCLVTVREISQPLPPLSTTASASLSLADSATALGEDLDEVQY